jgi:putative MATE family efflux protein
MIQMENPQARFVQGSLWRHVAVMSLTTSLGLVAVFSVDLINILYISWLGNPHLQAALGYAAAILFMTTSFGIGLSIASSALVARAVGARDPAMARQRATSGLWLAGITGGLFALMIWVFLSPLLTLLGATGETHAHALWFLQIVTPSQPLVMIGMTGGAILRSHGDARRAMWITLGAAIVTAALDPIFIFVLDMGLTGAAIVSVISRVVMAVVPVWFILRHHGGLNRPDWAGLRGDAGPLFAIGGPAILTQIATPIGQAYVTAAMSPFGEGAVGAMAIAGRLVPVAFGVIFALSSAVGPIMGQNLGAGRMDRVKQTYWEALKFTALSVVLVSALLFLLRAPLADLFHATGQTRELLYLFCGPLALLWFFNGVIFVGNATCNNLGKPFWSTVINWGRNTLGTIPLVILMAGWWGADGVLIGQALGGVLFALLAHFVAVRVIRSRQETTQGGS